MIYPIVIYFLYQYQFLANMNFFFKPTARVFECWCNESYIWTYGSFYCNAVAVGFGHVMQSLATLCTFFNASSCCCCCFFCCLMSVVWWLHPSASSPLLILMPFSCRQHLEPYCVVVLFVGTVWMHSGFNVQCLSFFFLVRIVDYREKTWAKHKVVITTCKREFQLFLCEFSYGHQIAVCCHRCSGNALSVNL